MIRVSYSQLASMSECERRWQLSRRYEPRARAAALAEGDLMHLVLGKFYGTKSKDTALGIVDAYNKQYQEEIRTAFDAVGAKPDERLDELEVKIGVLRSMASTYWDLLGVNDLKLFDVEQIETPFELELAPGILLVGIIDGIWKHKQTGVRYIVEHKYRQEHHEDLMSLDLQVSLYTLAMLPKYGHLPTLYNVIRKPQYRRKVGQAADDFIKSVETRVREETETISSLDATSRFFIRKPYSRGKIELKVAAETALELARRMITLKVRPEQVVRVVNDQCLYRCAFRDICVDEDPMVLANRFIETGKQSSTPLPGERVITV